MRNVGVGLVCFALAFVAVASTSGLDLAWLFAIAGVAAWLLIAIGVDFVLRGFGLPGRGWRHGKRAVVRAFVLLAIAVFAVPGLVFLLLLTKESGPQWTLAVFVILLTVVVGTAVALFGPAKA